MNINEVSKKLSISKDTIRYWEKIGLLPSIPRNASGYREYSQKEFNWVYYIKALRNAGMSIERLLEFVHLYLKDANDLNHRKELLIQQREELLAEITKRQETVDYLTYKIDHFEEHVLNQYDESKGD
ncbi:MerR family transcriptional regulator [Apilactobacillus apinorum]|uniref:MerR family transcriptional regulator n=1 Tax=Apilactobacillus apinorum TaxID=1218495 RepID=A0ABP9ZHR8_9LACO|nr:MerR family transcriptional regulator [Apilactobacillus apinorum]KOY69856.1 MerR family transcriptional regulator [Apilactobacillus apinorum]CAI2614933.1 MerR family transcriptional regulator [Apilactobacillus apinorum]